MQHSIDKLRLLVVAVIIVIAFLANIIQLYRMQVVNQLEYQKKATEVSSRSSIIHAPRGEIYDRNLDIPYVSNTESFTVMINPANVGKENFPLIFSKLSKILNVSESFIENKLPRSLWNSYQNIEIQDSVSFDKIIEIAEIIDEFPGILWESVPIRNYLFNGSISHLLGYVGKISRNELQVLFNDGYTISDNIGKNGVEKQYDLVLRGEKGIKYRTVDVYGKKLSDKNIKPDVNPVPGNSLVLTVDRNIQTLAEKALGKRKGSVIVLKPNNGEILAMVSYPWYEPGEFNIPGKNAFGQLLINPDRPLINRAMQAYAPASTFKVIMSAAVLQENAVPDNFTVECTGSVFYGDRSFGCWLHTGHGTEDLGDAFRDSCNIYYYTVGRDYLGIDKISNYARDFGFGQLTGIDIPNESSGQIPTPEWVKNVYNQTWTHGDTMNVSIGQGRTLVTPLQIANSLAFVLNNGTIYKPHIVKEIRNPSTNSIVEEIALEVIHKSTYEEEVFTELKNYMRSVVTEGTAKNRFQNKVVEIAGKTGTAQVGSIDKFHDYFISYGPYDAPVEEQVVIVVMIEASNEPDPYRPWSVKATDLIYQGIFAKQTFEEVVDTLKPYYLWELWR